MTLSLPVIPADLLEEEVGGTAVATANLISLEVTYTRILNAYLRPVIAERMTAINEQMGSIKPVAEALGTINAAASANAVNRQHFLARTLARGNSLQTSK